MDTLGELVKELYDTLGTPEEYDPYEDDGVTLDTGSEEWATLVRGLNSAVRALLTWKDPIRGWQFRFKSCYEQRYVQAVVLSGTAQAGGTTHTLQLDASHTGGAANGYRDWVVDVGDGTYRTVVASDAASVTVGKAFTAAPDATTTYSLYQRYILITIDRQFVDVLKVFDMEADQELNMAPRGTTYRSPYTLGAPSEWLRRADKIFFDTVPSDERWLELECYILPAAMAAEDDVPPVPPQFRWGLVLWAQAWGFSHTQEPADMKAAQQRFVDFMRSTQGELDIDQSRNADLGGVVEVG